MSASATSLSEGARSGDLGQGGIMKTRTFVSVVVAAVLFLGAMLFAAPSASAANCRPNTLGPTDISGNQRYTCPDGSYTLRKPLGASGWNDPMTSYELRPNSGSSLNRPSQRCRYNSLFNRYDCR